MRYEFIHDSIAKQVFTKAGAEAQTRRKVEKYIREHYDAYRERGAELTDDDIDYIKPYLALVNIGPEEARFVREGERKLQRKRMRRRALTAGIIAILFAATVISLFFLRRATVAERAATQSAIEANEQRRRAETTSDSLAVRETELERALVEAKLANDTAEIRRIEAEIAQAEAERQADIARRERALAERRAREAQSLALAATARSIEDQLPTEALKLAEVAYGVIPESPLPSVAQTLSALFYEQLPDGDGGDPGAPLFRAALPYDATQFDGRNPDQRRRFAPTWSAAGDHYLLPIAPGRVGLYSGDGRSVATVTHDAAPHLVGVLQRGAHGTVSNNTIPPVDAAAWAPAGDRFATGDEAGRVKIWNTQGQLLNEGSLPDWVSELTFSPDGRYLYAWSNGFTVSSPEASIYSALPSNRNLWIWDTESGELTDSGLFLGQLPALTFAADGRSFLLPSGQYDLAGQENFSFTTAAEGKGRELWYSRAGNTALVRYNNGIFHLWDLRGREIAFTLGSAEDPIAMTILAPDGQTVLAFHENKTAGLYGSGGRLLSELPPDSYTRGAIAPGGAFLTAGTPERDIVWTLRSESLIVLTENVNPDIAPQFTPDGQLFFLDGESRLARWRTRVGTQPLSDLHTANIRNVTIDPSGRWILSRDEDGIAYLWTTGGAAHSRLDKHPGYIHAAAFSPTGDALLTADRRGTALLWEVDQVALVRQLTDPDGRINDMIPIPQSADFITVTRNKQHVLRSWEGGRSLELVGNSRQPVKSATSPDGELIAIQVGNRPVVIWDRATGEEKATIGPGLTQLGEFAFTADGRSLAAVDDQGQVRLWSRDGTPRGEGPGENRNNGALKVAPSGGFLLTNVGPTPFQPAPNITLRMATLGEFSPTGGYLVADERFVPSLFRIRYRPERGVELAKVPLEIVSIAPSQDDTGSGVRVWSTNGTLRQKIRFPANSRPEHVRFSPDGSLFAVQLARSGTVVYDSLGRMVTLNRALRGPQYVFFSPDNRRVLATYGTNTARLFDRSGRQLAELNQLNEPVQSAAFSPDGQSILLVGTGRSAQLYDASGQLLASFDRHGATLEKAIFTEDGQFVITLDRDGTLRRFPVPGRIFAWLQATGRLPGLTQEQRDRYGVSELNLDNDR